MENKKLKEVVNQCKKIYNFESSRSDVRTMKLLLEYIQELEERVQKLEKPDFRTVIFKD